MINVSVKSSSVKISVPTSRKREYEECLVRALDGYNGITGGYTEAVIIDSAGVETPIHGLLDDYKGSSQIQVRWDDDDDGWLVVTVLV